MATANTDAVNRAKMRFPVEGLAESVERAIEQAAADKTPYGTVSLISHDYVRPIGWTRPLGLHLSGTLARLATTWEVADSKEEAERLATVHRRTMNARFTRQAKAREADFRKQMGEIADGASFMPVGGAFALKADGLAAKLYPDLFDENSQYVDKDGLVSLPELLRRFEVFSPGIFLDRARNVLLFAHPYFRRSLSHLNTLNEVVLRQLLDLQKEDSKLDIRLKLDADRIGDPPDRGTIELEHWWGPTFQDDIAEMQSGVAKHAADDETKLYAGIEFTEFWWKAAEDRPDGSTVRTFEMEELPLLDVPSAGISREYYGARYLHAEYTEGVRAITHFDGAIRGYPGEKYLARQESDIKSAGKHAEYTKLFRVDGEVSVDTWKRVSCAYYRNNFLVPEYFAGKPGESEIEDEKESGTDRALSVPIEGMVGYFPLAHMTAGKETVLCSFEDPLNMLGGVFRPFDIPPKNTQSWLRQFPDFRDNILAGHNDGNVNLPSMVFGGGISKTDLGTLFQGLGQAIAQDNYPGKVGCSFLWPCGQYWVAVSLLGEAPAVAAALQSSIDVVDPAQPPSKWIAPWKDIVCAECAPDLEPRGALNNLQFSGLLSFSHKIDGQSVEVIVPPTHPLFGPMSEGVPKPDDAEPVSAG